MDPQSLEIFVAAVRSGTVLGAAKACKTSRGRVRRKLEELESWAQTELFVRRRAGLELTDAGALLLERVEPMLGELDRVREEARRAGEAPSGVLRIVANALTPSFGAPEFFALCAQRMPQVRVEGEICGDVIAKLREGYEVGLLLAHDVPPGPWTAFRAFRLQAGLFASRDYVERHGSPKNLREIAEHPLATWRYPGADGSSIPLRNGGRMDILPLFASSYGEPIHRLVASGMVIGHYAAGPFEGESLVPILPDEVSYPVHLYVLLTRQASAIPRVREIRRLLEMTAERVSDTLDDADAGV